MSPEVSWALLIVSVVATVALGWMAVNAGRLYAGHVRAHDDKAVLAEHGLVTLSVLALIAAANVMTGVGFVLDDDGVRTVGAVIVRGALVSVVLYLVLRRPDTP